MLFGNMDLHETPIKISHKCGQIYHIYMDPSWVMKSKISGNLLYAVFEKSAKLKTLHRKQYWYGVHTPGKLNNAQIENELL